MTRAAQRSTWVHRRIGAPAVRRSVTCVATAALLLVSGPPQVALSSSVRCADVIIRTGDGSVYTRTRSLVAVGAGCATARRVARAFLAGSEGSDASPRPLGYVCTNSGSGVSCRRGARRVRWSY